LELLRGLKDEHLRAPSTLAIAGVYDELLEVPAQEGWRVVVEAAARRDHEVKQYAAERAQWLDYLRQGSVESLDGDRLTRQAAKTPGKMLTIDSWHLRGIARLVADRPADAVKAFQQAAALAATIDPYQSAQAGLLLSDALRRAGNAEQADRVWHETVVAAAQLTARQPPLSDPAFWDKASYLRPVVHPWPDEVVTKLESCGPFQSQEVDTNLAIVTDSRTPGDQETIVWGWIGDGLLDRNEAQSALVALKRAESAAQSDTLRQLCRLHQAHALVRLGQMAPATAILVGLSSNKSPSLANAATAALGSLKFHQGDVSAAHRLLVKALEDGGPAPWLGRTDAESDLGLVTLLRGDEPGGLNRLRQAQRQYETRGDRLALARSLWNEQKFLEHVGKKDEAKATKVRWQELESVTTTLR
jgi:tetratricopeptide (TPR) repeat protein